MGCIQTTCTWQAPISWTTCSTGALSSRFQQSRCGCFPRRTANALPKRSPAFLLQSRRSSSFWHVTVASIADESACVRLADPELLPPSTLAAVRAAEAVTKDYSGMHLTIAVAYGGREEIVDAVRGLLREQLAQNKTLEEVIELVTPEAIGRSLYAPHLPDPDLIIRTSGEIRLSGFLLWQSVFSEFYFTDVYWPAFRRIDFLRALRAFQQRQRRFGK